MIESAIAFWKQLLFSPEPLTSVWAFPIPFLALALFPGLVVTWITALIYKGMSRGHLGAPITIRMAWSWGAICVMVVLVAHGITLTLLDRMPDWTAATPEAGVALAAALVAFGNWRVMRMDLKASQKVLFAAR